MGATKESDDALRKEYRTRGANDRYHGIPRHDCPVDGLLAQWWWEGWDGIPAEPAVALAIPPLKPDQEEYLRRIQEQTGKYDPNAMVGGPNKPPYNRRSR